MITLINSFQVPAGSEDEFFALWEDVNRYMRAKPGYLRHRLHRSISPGAAYRFINVADWESREAFDRAHDAGFHALLAKPEWERFRAVPALVETVHEGRLGS